MTLNPLFGITELFAEDARLHILPRLGTHNLHSLAWHIIPVTVLPVLFVVVGVSFRNGWFMRRTRRTIARDKNAISVIKRP